MLTQGDIDIAQLARLARLSLAGPEQELLRTQLSAVLAHIERLDALDTQDVAPLVHALEQPNVFRPDRVRGGLPTSSALANAPREDGGFFLVPQVLE